MKYIVIFQILSLQIFAQNQKKIDSLQNIYSGELSLQKKAEISYNIANQYLNHNEDSARKYIAITLKNAKNSADLFEIGISNNLNAVFLANHGQYDESIRASLVAISYFEKAKNLRWQGKALSTLGYTYKRMADAQKIASISEKGEYYVKKALEILEKTKDFDSIASAYINLGIIQRDLKDFKGAKISFEKGLQIAKIEPISKLTEAILYADLGQNFIDFGKDYDKAIFYLKKAIPMYEQEKYTKGTEHAHRNLADVYRLKNDFANANFHAEKAVELAKTLNDNHRLFNAYNALYRVNEASGNYKAAFDNLKLAKKHEDSTLKLEKLKSIAEVESKYENVKKEAEIGLLNEKNQIQAKQLIYLLIGLAVALGLLAAIFLQNKKIKESKKQITEQAEQLKLMMKELHHRVKNNLAIVSGLLRIQSNKLEDESAIQAVRQGQQRVDAMSLIHQRLYQTDKVTTVNIKEYIIDLAESLMSAYGYAPNEFDLNISVEKEELDVDLAIPLGLIINELLTNSFKYAYQDIENPALNISLKGDKNLELEIKDNGIGIDLNRWKTAKDSFGKKMIAGLVSQIGGKFTIENDGGTVFKMKIAA